MCQPIEVFNVPIISFLIMTIIVLCMFRGIEVWEKVKKYEQEMIEEEENDKIHT